MLGTASEDFPALELGQSICSLRNIHQINNYCNFQEAYRNPLDQTMRAVSCTHCFSWRYNNKPLIVIEACFPVWLRSLHKSSSTPITPLPHHPPSPSLHLLTSNRVREETFPGAQMMRSTVLYFSCRIRHDTTGDRIQKGSPEPPSQPPKGPLSQGRSRADMSSPYWHWSSQQDRAGGCCCKSIPSPARCQGAALWSAAIPQSGRAARWPAGGSTGWIPSLCCNDPEQAEQEGVTKHRSHLSSFWISLHSVCINRKNYQFRSYKFTASYLKLENLVLMLKKIFLSALNLAAISDLTHDNAITVHFLCPACTRADQQWETLHN